MVIKRIANWLGIIMHKSQKTWLLVTFVLLSFFSLFFALSFGAAAVSFNDVSHTLLNMLNINFFDATTNRSLIEKIIIELRMPRTILAFLAGIGLALSGLILQTVTRNPLADPYLFGISSGASFGVVLLMTFIAQPVGIAMSVAAFIGSLVAMLVLIVIAGAKRSGQVESMLLAGVALSFLFSAFTSLLLYLTDPQAITAILFWTMGSFARATWDNLLFPTLVIIICMLFMFSYRRQLSAMLLGDESATTLGINVNRFRMIMLILSSLITATLVSLCGGIGFVGLMIPHIVRFFISQASTIGLLVTALAGGVFMIWVDVLSRIVLSNQELPVGVITAAAGSLFFLGLLYFRTQKVH